MGDAPIAWSRKQSDQLIGYSIEIDEATGEVRSVPRYRMGTETMQTADGTYYAVVDARGPLDPYTSDEWVDETHSDDARSNQRRFRYVGALLRVGEIEGTT